MTTHNTNYTLSNGVEIPSIGLGTWQTPDGEVAREVVAHALRSGYRHIDTAAVYGNEKGVGLGIRESGVSRNEIFVTSKVWNTCRGYDATMRAFEQTLSDLQTDYLDLYLIHWPAVARQFDNWKYLNLSTWHAMEALYHQGVVRAIGVSNFMPHHLEPLIAQAEVLPMVNQIEYHPGFMQHACVDFCKEHGILVEAWSPLGTGRMLSNPQLLDMAGKYGVSVAQLCVRWVLQHGILPLPKSITPTRIEQNIEVDCFEISSEDMAIIDAMQYCGGSGLDPDVIDF